MVEINKTVTKSVTTYMTTNFKWISGETEPVTPVDYTRTSELDIDLGVMGKLWGFMRVS